MKLPKLAELTATRSVIDAFGGYNHNLRIGDGEFYDMKNLTSSYYPVLSPRAPRGTYVSAAAPRGMIAKDALCYVDGNTLFIGGKAVSGLLLQSGGEKTLISMGAYLIILPDRKYVNTANTAEYGSIEAGVTTAGEVTVSLCRQDGSAFGTGENIPTGATAPETPTDRQYWIDTGSTPHALKQYSETSGLWTSVATTYLKISAAGIGAGFSQYDGVTISGIKGKTDRADLDAIDGNFILWAAEKNSLVIVGMLDEVATLTAAVTVRRTMPDMDFVIESENRLWGCKYGVVNGKPVNEIYACRQGDFKNWNCFMGLSTDSYAASVGTDGVFTGAITYLGYPLFFKENFVHKVFGNYPANYQIQTTACRGVQKGSGKSLAMVNETLFYKGKNGVLAYDGSLPSEISSALGDVAYRDAVAASHGNKYYISMKDETGQYTLFVFDTARGLWHKEDHVQVDAFCSCRNELYYIDHSGGGIRTLFGSGRADTAKIHWMAETGVIGGEGPDRKYLSALNVRMSLSEGARVSFFVQYDSMGAWEHVCTQTAGRLKSFTMPIRPRRCDHLRLRMEGTGDAKVYSLVKTMEEGSDTP